ncbi:MAG: transglutaminase family protein [Candidatus Methylacidiphilales bacterium]|nr:transglutaminase family protein [Candidatus Methylacidiphilales bacterium]
MRFHVSNQIQYKIEGPTTLILNVHALRTPSQSIISEHFQLDPILKYEEFVSASGENRFVRLETGDAKALRVSYNAEVDVNCHVFPHSNLGVSPVSQMHRNVIPFLFPSRYCQSDRLYRLAFDKFGAIPTPYEKVVAITDWINSNVEYTLGSTDSGTSAFDTVTQRQGVCRDFAHLGIALCRALTIPARYFSGYAYQLQPPDFHACFEAYIGGQWLFFDATRLAPLNGLVRIGTGRDAADTAIGTIFGRMKLETISVQCTLAPGEENNFKPVTREDQNLNAVSLDTLATPPPPQNQVNQGQNNNQNQNNQAPAPNPNNNGGAPASNAPNSAPVQEPVSV